MSQETSNLEWIKIAIQSIGYLGGWALVVWGWNVSNGHNRVRDERKDLRDRVSEVAELIRNVEADVVAFLTAEEGGARTSSFWTVHFGVQRVNLSIVMSSAFDTESIQAALIEYRKAVTGQALDGPTSTPKNAANRDKDLRRVSKYGSALIRQLEARHCELYPLQAKAGR